MDMTVKHRDENLDNLRGFAMVWVILIHVLFWGNLFTDGYAYVLKSFLLFEMPLFFFITGASNSMAQKYSYGKFVTKRFEHCLIPYWVFAFICAVLSVAVSIIQHGEVANTLKILVSWALPIDHQITSVSYLTWALWFIPVYLCVVLFIPAFRTIKETNFSTAFFVVLVFIFFGSSLLKLGWIQNVLFYFVWTYIGLYYQQLIRERKENKSRVSLGVIAFLISGGAVYVLHRLGYSLNMQSNKFPPNIVFFFFSFMAMSFLYLIYPVLESVLIHLKQNKLFGVIFKIFCTKSMTVFLYQVFAFNITLRLINYLSIGNSFLAMSCKAVICFISTVLLCWILGIVFGKIESWSLLSYIDRKN